MANFETKTIKQIYNGIIAKYTTLRNKYGDSAPLLEIAAVRSLAYAIAGVAGTLWQLATWIYKECFPQTCGLFALKLWGKLVGVDYNDGKTSNVTIILSNVTAEKLSTGTTYKDLSSGLIFKTNSEARTNAGTITATAQCTTPGEIGNLPVGTVLQITNPYDGIPSTAIIVNILVYGTEDEKVEDYRKRVLSKFQNKPFGGTALDYFNWTTEVEGITDALVYVLTEGIVKIFVVAEGSGVNRTPSGTLSPNPFPTWTDGNFNPLTGSGKMLAVANSIEGSSPGIHDRRPINAKVELSAPVYTPFRVEITGLTDTSYNQAIKEALIQNLNQKRPNIAVLNYPVSNAKINRLSLSALVSEIVNGEIFTTFTLKNGAGQSIDEATLGIGSLAYLSSLTINGQTIAI